MCSARVKAISKNDKKVFLKMTLAKNDIQRGVFQVYSLYFLRKRASKMLDIDC